MITDRTLEISFCMAIAGKRCQICVDPFDLPFQEVDRPYGNSLAMGRAITVFQEFL
jgi:hypothetical protein